MRAEIFFKRFTHGHVGWTLSALFAVFLTASLHAQNKVTTDIVFDKSSSPAIKVEALDWPRGSAQPKAGSDYADKRDDKWVSFSAEFFTEKEMMEEVKVVIYVEAYDTLVTESGSDNGKLLKASEHPKFVVLKGETTFLNVYKGRHVVNFYLHPSMVKRFGAGERSGRGFTTKTSDKTLNVRLEAFAKDGSAAEYLDRITDDKNWISSAPVIEKSLVGADESPWWPGDAPRYEQIKKQ